jgi:dienelactone hydrolase
MNANQKSVVVDDIPVLYVEPRTRRPGPNVVLWLGGLTSSKEDSADWLGQLADAGFVAVSFDAWQHGARGKESRAEMGRRVFGNFRHSMWPILGNTVLESLRIIDWAVREFSVERNVYMGGLSMGGDISVAAAGVDKRIRRVAAIVATPDWLRPGMHDLFNPAALLPTGEADAYAQYFYDQFNPLTHLDHYAHGPSIRFVNAAEDTHVPPDGALRFQQAFRQQYPQQAEAVQVTLVPAAGHMDSKQPAFWEPCLEWFTKETLP